MDDGTNRMRKQKYDTIKRSGRPDCTHMNSQQEGVECQHCRPWRKLPIVSVPIPYNKNPQTRRQKGKGRVCLGEEGDSKEEEKGKEEIRGVAHMQHWSGG